MQFITLLTRRFPLLLFNTICCSVIYSGPRVFDPSGLFYSLVACVSPEIPRVQKGNSFWTQASDVNASTALPFPPSSPAFKFKCSLLALGEQIYCISSALFLPPCVTLSASPSAYCFYSPTFVSTVLNFTLQIQTLSRDTFNCSNGLPLLSQSSFSVTTLFSEKLHIFNQKNLNTKAN